MSVIPSPGPLASYAQAFGQQHFSKRGQREGSQRYPEGSPLRSGRNKALTGLALPNPSQGRSTRKRNDSTVSCPSPTKPATVSAPALRSGSPRATSALQDVESINPYPTVATKPSEASTMNESNALNNTPLVMPSEEHPAQDGGTGSLVYVVGTLGYDFGTEARRDTFAEAMQFDPQVRAILSRDNPPDPPISPNPADPDQLLAYLGNNPEEAASLIWTLSLDGAPFYAIAPAPAFADVGYNLLREWLSGRVKVTEPQDEEVPTWVTLALRYFNFDLAAAVQHQNTDLGLRQFEGIERVSIPGVLAGEARLLSGHVVPVIEPELRGMYGWSTIDLFAYLFPNGRPAEEGTDQDIYDQTRAAMRNFLELAYHHLRNLGLDASDRALNFLTTHIFRLAAGEAAHHDVNVKDFVGRKLALRGIVPTASPISRPDSDCWDVMFTLFNPNLGDQANEVYRFIVDVIDVVPVIVGPVKRWWT